MSRNGQSKSAKMVVDRWLDLPTGPLGQIFTYLNPVDMLLVVPFVCKYWGRILCEIIFFKKNSNLLDFGPLLFPPFTSIFYGSANENLKAMQLMNFLMGVMHALAPDSESDVGTCAVRTTPIFKIVFTLGLPLYDRHLVYIAERCPELKSISLCCAKNITGRGIARAMRFWTGMEEISYGPFCVPPHYDLHFSRAVEEFGINCKNLRFLNLTCLELNWQSADIIVRNLKSVKSLCLGGANIHKYGLQIFLSRCKKLDGVKFTCCILKRSKQRGVFVGEMNITRIQEGRRTRWRTDRFRHAIGKLHTSKELVDLLWK
ncbi:hypothetical protein POM88_031337 [Heracleum sosnowskyi]|uniref:F-box domain-containing protein n=1 Tax=Heracleum sosnowskyi TaxID=360622 RepID=A0AAD8HX75_9APIA|nr:hypothetical protein POM88_031337 [Heracleum sosnowskyi]